MNWNQFECSVSYLCLCGTVLAPLFITQGVVGSNTIFYRFLLHIPQNFDRSSSTQDLQK